MVNIRMQKGFAEPFSCIKWWLTLWCLWNGICRACLRFLILHQNGYRMLLSGGEAIHTEEASPEASVSGSSLTGTLRNSAFCGRQVGATSFPDTRKNFSSRGLETKATVALMKFGENVGIKSKPSWTYHRHQGNLETSTRPSEIPCKPSDVPCNLESSMRPSDIPCKPSAIPCNLETKNFLLLWFDWTISSWMCMSYLSACDKNVCSCVVVLAA